VNQDCLKLTSYFAEHDKTGRRFLVDALLDCYGRHRLATSALLRGTRGSDPASGCRPSGCSPCRKTCPWSPSRSTPASGSNKRSMR
jgi:hypothetical protein